MPATKANDNQTQGKKNKKKGRPKEQLSPKFLAHTWKPKGPESNLAKISFRLPLSLRRRLDRFKEENGRLPWDEVREFLDGILPPDPGEPVEEEEEQEQEKPAE